MMPAACAWACRTGGAEDLPGMLACRRGAGGAALDRPTVVTPAPSQPDGCALSHAVAGGAVGPRPMHATEQHRHG